MYTLVNDTIVAVSSAPGHAARGIVRLSGPLAITVAAQLFKSRRETAINRSDGMVALEGELILGDSHRLPAAIYLFRAPRSYTRQDLVELHTVGSPPLLALVMDRCLQAGARPAEPGEFTARAFLCGAMNLTEAEAVATTIQARSDHQLRAARRMMAGRLTERINDWQNDLSDLSALVVADIDFAEEPTDFITRDELSDRLNKLRNELTDIIAQSDSHQRLDVLPHVLLMGPPNAGKSTLLNTLSCMDRAIASAVSGTTRDILSAPVRLPGVDVIMLDAAGIEDRPDSLPLGTVPTSGVLAEGERRTRQTAAAVDLVCLVVDAAEPIDPSAVTKLARLTSAKTVIVGTKIDVVGDAEMRRRQGELESAGAGSVCMVSALADRGMNDLRTLLADRLGASAKSAEDAGVSLTARQRVELSAARSALDRCTKQVAGTARVLDSAELIAFDLREASDALARITGSVTTEDLLSRVFAAFCIGK